MGGALKFKQANTPRQMGELARVKIVQGPDQGCVFVIMTPNVTLGRGDSNDIVLSDLKSSRLHAKIVFEKNQWMMLDQGSSNGIYSNGKQVREVVLAGNEVLTIGETTFEFILSKAAGTAMLTAPPRSVAQFRAEQAVYANQVRKARGQEAIIYAGTQGNTKSPVASFLLSKKFMLPFFVVMLAMMLADDETGNTKKKKKNPGLINPPFVGSFMAENPAATAAAEMFFKSGFREYRERNYLRAKQQFEMVLQVSPTHELAQLYLDNCNREIEEEIKRLLDTGSRSLKAGKYKEAKGNFESVMRLKYREQDSDAYKDAREQRQIAIRALRGEPSEMNRLPASEQSKEGGE